MSGEPAGPLPRRGGDPALLPLALALVLAGCGGGEGAGGGASPDSAAILPAEAVSARETSRRALLLDPDHPAWSEPAPDTFHARFVTSEGDFTIEGIRAWAPRGADRFHALVRHGYYDDARFHRVVPGFIVQWGLAGDPAVTAAWIDRTIPDDPAVVAGNTRGTVAFAFTEVDTRATQVYINLVDNSRLDAQGFPPFGRVIEGMDVVDRLFGGYGEESGGGMRAGRQDSVIAGGNAYLDRAFPELDRIVRAEVVPRR